MFLIDAHNDTAYRMYFEKEHLSENNLQTDMKKQKGFRTLLLYAIFMDPQKVTEFSSPFLYFDTIYQNFLKEIKENESQIELTHSAASLLSAKKQQAMLLIEGGSLIESMETIDRLLQRGIKVLTLTWNDSNALGTSAMSKDSGGLTDFGKRILRKMNSQGMIADLSHASDQTFWDVLNTTDKPVLVSHSNSRSLWNHPRNITDEMFQKLMEQGGVLGINFYPPFLGEDASLETVFRHIEHFLELGGENHIGFGSDFDGVDCLPKGITDFSSFSDMLLEMEKRNYSKNLIEKICYKNMMRILS